MRVGEDPNHAIDFGIAAGHPRNKAGENDDAIPQPEPAGASKVGERGFDYFRRSPQSVSESFQRHARITRVSTVIVAQEPKRESAHLFNRGGRDP